MPVVALAAYVVYLALAFGRRRKRLDGDRILRQDREVGELARLDTPDLVLQAE